jgi:hypothetical protein
MTASPAIQFQSYTANAAALAKAVRGFLPVKGGASLDESDKGGSLMYVITCGPGRRAFVQLNEEGYVYDVVFKGKIADDMSEVLNDAMRTLDAESFYRIGNEHVVSYRSCKTGPDSVVSLDALMEMLHVHLPSGYTGSLVFRPYQSGTRLSRSQAFSWSRPLGGFILVAGA